MNKNLILLQGLTGALGHVADDIELRQIDFFRGIEKRALGFTCTVRIEGRTHCVNYRVPEQNCTVDELPHIEESIKYQMLNLVEEVKNNA